jgi:WD40 repeat protein
MKAMPLAVVCLTVFSAAAMSQEIDAIASFGTPVPERAGGWKGHVDYLQWAGGAIVCGGKTGFLRCFNVETKQQRWAAQLKSEVRSIAVAIATGQVFALDDANDIHVFGLTDGKESDLISSGKLATLCEKKFVVPSNIAWIRDAEQILVTNYSETYGDNGFLFQTTPFKKAATIKSDGHVREITTDASGRFIVMQSRRDNIRIWDTKAGREIFKLGKDEDLVIDGPFVSHAIFDGQHTLVYTVDNSWATGKIFVYDIMAGTVTAQFDSRHGHVVMDVDFVHGRIALTGTNRTLIILDLSGKVIADKPAATWQRNVAVAFSPNGERLAVGSWDNTVRVFAMKVPGGK